MNDEGQTKSPDDPRRDLPSVDALLNDARLLELAAEWSRPLVIDAIHDTLARQRLELAPGAAAPSPDEVVVDVRQTLLAGQRDRLRPVVNAAGILLHTGLGRAVLPQRAAEALGAMDACCNLQLELETGLRGKRNFATEQLLCKLTGAEAAMVVNNNAAATFLILAVLAAGREVIISRGQLIEIGGSFRLPDCMALSGAKMVEVGTTNKTHPRDYEQALNDDTAMILRVNPSNYRIVGFQKSVSTRELVALKRTHPALVVDDLGCGALLDLRPYGLPAEPTVQDSIAAGADLVCFSGDKLISGPQAGIIVGKKALIQQLKKHPFTRMFRICKLTDVALEQTLRLFLEPETLLENNPTLRMLTAPAEKLKPLAERLASRLAKLSPALNVEMVESESAVGGGSLPACPIKTFAVALSSERLAAEPLNAALRRHEPPIIARIYDNRVMLDVRTLLPGDEDVIVDAVQTTLAPLLSGDQASE